MNTPGEWVEKNIPATGVFGWSMDKNQMLSDFE